MIFINKTITILTTTFIKQKVLLCIALIISILLTLPRILIIFGIVDDLSTAFTPASIKDILFRFLWFTLFSWLLLEFNANTKYFYSKFQSVLRGLTTVIINIALYLALLHLFLFLYPRLVGESMVSEEQGLTYFIYFVVAIIAIFIARILRYQLSLKEKLIEQEALKQQSLQNELMALKNQVNPHFLFNSLNSLSALVKENNDATSFINKLSYLYRYILQSSERDLVTLEEELEFLKSYIYLIKVRYRSRFSINYNLDESLLKKKVPILALQLLVENAVKHNEISEEHPLEVNIYSEDGFIVIENKIRPRKTLSSGTGNGLANLNKRYYALKKKHISISNTNNIFKVKLSVN
ncbi:sensor histidine kinase [Flavivirga spongiicola]|uniref:Histidine kinase n=1 Tax=Flavivirga spongiicola TaxID=421621 RepID=A0ABU7XVF2_9FLAO|nr:histidine kinase [Flavivirga sp. MEBiC05379]MDO5979558.1 histidine kinase [Flavivirga sp. MEBiC05379]